MTLNKLGHDFPGTLTLPLSGAPWGWRQGRGPVQHQEHLIRRLTPPFTLGLCSDPGTPLPPPQPMDSGGHSGTPGVADMLGGFLKCLCGASRGRSAWQTHLRGYSMLGRPTLCTLRVHP